MTPLRQNFIQRLELKGFTRKTVVNYVQVVARLSKFYNCSPLDLTAQQIKDYFHHHIKNKLLAPRSINLHIGALKTFYNFMLPESDIMKDFTSMKVPVAQFIQRFLLHVLPAGFVRIRYFGFMSNRNRKEKIIQCRVAITAEVNDTADVIENLLEDEVIATVVQTCCCPECRKGKLVLMEEIPKRAGPVWFRAA